MLATGISNTVLYFFLVLCFLHYLAEAFLQASRRQRIPATILGRFETPSHATIDPSARSSTSSSTCLFMDLWDRMEIEEDEEAQWYLLNCVAGLELDLLQQCRVQCGGLPDVVKFVVPTITKTRSHGAKRMVQDTKVKYQGYVFAKLRLTRDTYMVIQQLDLCRSWMGTINMKGYRKLPPAPLPLTEEEIENFDLENFKWVQDEQQIVSAAAVKEKDRTIIVDTEDYDLEETRILDEIEEEVQVVYKGLKVEDMVKVTSKNKFHNEDGIVRRLKEGMVLIRFFTYGTVFDEWLDPSEVRKLTEAEILKGLGGPSAPITQRDLDGPQEERDDRRDPRDGFDRRNQAGAFGGGPRDRRQDRTERRFRDDRDDDNRKERDNWNWYKQNEQRSREGGYSDGEEHIRGSADQRESRSNFWAESDVESQWGRNNAHSRPTRDQRQQRNNDRRRQDGDWNSFISKSSPAKKREPPTKEETDDFFASLMSDLSSDVGSGGGSGQRNNDSGDESDDDFFASLMSEINDEKKSISTSGSTDVTRISEESDDDDFFASLEQEIQGSTRSSSSRNDRENKNFNAEKQLDDLFAELSLDADGSSDKATFVEAEDDFFASLEKELTSDLGKDTQKEGSASIHRSAPAVDLDEDDFFSNLEAELAEDLNQDVKETNQEASFDDVDAADDFFASLEAETYSNDFSEPRDELVENSVTNARSSNADPFPTRKEPERPDFHHHVIDISALQKRTIPELKDMLRERGLKVSGKKAELIDRLSTSATS